MRRAERVVDVDVGERGQLLAEGGVVLLLALVEAQVLEQQHVAVAQRGRLGLGILAHRVAREHDRLAEKLGKAQRGRAQAERLLVTGARRTSQVAHQDDARAVADELLDRGQRGADARVIGDDAVFDRHVEVDAHQHLLASRVERIDRFDITHVHSPSNVSPQRSAPSPR